MIQKIVFTTVSGILLSAGIAFGAAEPAMPSLDDLYFGAGDTPNPVLTPQERQALEIARKWQADNATNLKPVPGPEGSIRFLFGATQPSIVCAVMQVTDIELQLGEMVNSIHVGDSARWLIEPALTGSGVAEVQHLVIKPMDVGLETSLMVTTNRRTYHLRLKSHRTEYMPKVSFIYPDSIMAKWEAQKARHQDERKKKTLPETGEYMGNLNFNYEISGNAPWKPLRVYNDGVKTIIQMPPSMKETEAPTLLALNGKEQVMVNYRLQGDRFIVDALFEKAMLIAGVGSGQHKIIITRQVK